MQKKLYSAQKHKATWEPMKISFSGKVSALVQNGCGKTRICTSDPGEYKKDPYWG